jgi:hypothetical protein
MGHTMRAILLVAAAVAALPGCASAPADPAKAGEARVYVTGSNISRRADQPTGSPTYGMSGDDLRKGRYDMPNVVPPPPDHRSPGS